MTSDKLTNKQMLTLAGAKAIAAAAEAEALRNKWDVVIAVVDDGGHLLLLQRLDDTQIGSVDIAIGQARSAVAFKRETKQWNETLKSGALAPLTFPGLICAEGGVPLVVGNRIVGAVGVSGVRGDQDAQIARAGAAALA